MSTQRSGDHAENHVVRLRIAAVAVLGASAFLLAMVLVADAFAAGAVALIAAAAPLSVMARPGNGLDGNPGGNIRSSLASAVPEWRAGRRAALEGMVAELAGPAYAAHALRCAGLCDRLGEQLALSAEEIDHLTLAAALHVLPVAFPADEDSAPDSCAFPQPAVAAAFSALERVAPAEVVRMASQARERWDGTGIPNRLAGEDVSMGGRVVAVACAFDHACAQGLRCGLDAARAGSGSAFDPVVVAELVYLFREPWRLGLAA